MGVNVEIVVLFSSDAEARAAVAEMLPVFRTLLGDQLQPRARVDSRHLIVSGLVRDVPLVKTLADARNLEQWPQVSIAIRMLAHRYGLDRVRLGNDTADLDYCPVESWHCPTLHELATMDQLHETLVSPSPNVRECTGCKYHVLTEDTWHGDCRFHPPQLVAVETELGHTTAFPVALGRCGKFEPIGE